MNTKTVNQINQIDAKRQLGLPLTAEEEALFGLYGIPLTQPKQEETNPDIEPSGGYKNGCQKFFTKSK